MHINPFYHSGRWQRAFTLVETIITTAIISVLFVMTTAGIQVATKNQRRLKETAAAHKLIVAYITAATDRDGEWLPGMDYRVTSLKLSNGKTISSHTCQRFPYRLAAYMENNLEGSLMLKENSKQIEKMAPRGSGMYEYVVSTFPAFGINQNFVGGVVNLGGVAYPEDCATRQSQTESPLLVFATACMLNGSTRMEGFNILTPPNLRVQNWSTAAWTEKCDPALYGAVDARHDGQAVCAFTDGSVRLLSIDDLRDMRLWSKNAASQGDPNYLIP